MICVCLGSAGCLRFVSVCHYWLLILTVAKNREFKKNPKPGDSLSFRGFLLTCVCSSAVRSSSSVEDIYLSISQAAVRLPSFPLLRAWFCTCWAQAFPTCASHPGSIRATVCLSYCTSQPLSAPSNCLHSLIFKPKQGWLES